MRGHIQSCRCYNELSHVPPRHEMLPKFDGLGELPGWVGSKCTFVESPTVHHHKNRKSRKIQLAAIKVDIMPREDDNCSATIEGSIDNATPSPIRQPSNILGCDTASEQSMDEEQAPLQQHVDEEMPSAAKPPIDFQRGLAKGQKPPNTVSIRKPVALILAVLLLGFTGAFGYSFAMWQKLKRSSTSSAREIPIRDDCVLKEPICEFSASDITNLQLKIDALESTVDELTLENSRLANSHGDCNSSNGELSAEIEALQDEIDRLEAANDQLGDQLEDYDDLNNRLNASIAELQVQNEILSDSNDRYESLNGQLNETLIALQEENVALEEQVDRFAELNENLNSTVQDLTTQVDRLEVQVDDLTLQNDRLEELVGSLNNETDRLWNLTNTLQSNVDRLEDRVEEFKTENTRLEGLVSDLETVTSFLNDTAGTLNESFEDLANFLSEQITTNRQIVLETLQNTYHQRVSNWDCALRDQFALEPFANNGNLAIPEADYPEVMTFVKERVLSELCLDAIDFKTYFEGRYANEDFTTNKLVTAVQRYTWEALDYYFPEEDETGLNEVDWATAKYNCEGLTPSQQFFI